MGSKESFPYLKILDKSIILSSTILLLEAERNITRLAREKIISVNEFKLAINRIKSDANFFCLRDFTPDLSLTGTFPSISTPRSLDLIHLRTALWFHGENRINYFLSLDQKLKQSAEELEFNVSPDEMDM